MVVFDHEKLEVYCVAVEYADAADAIAAKLKRGNAHIRDSLDPVRRAAQPAGSGPGPEPGPGPGRID
jgi:hypothetical protein